MNIKEKLTALGIDVDNDKDSVSKAKDKLKSLGFKADKINTKLESEGEKILEELFSNVVVSTPKVEVKAPPTIKSDEDIPIKSSKKIKKVQKTIQNDEQKEEENNENEVVPFWKKIKDKKTNLVIKQKGESKRVNSDLSPNGRPLPQSTIDDEKKKKEEKIKKELEEKIKQQEILENENKQKEEQTKKNEPEKINNTDNNTDNKNVNDIKEKKQNDIEKQTTPINNAPLDDNKDKQVKTPKYNKIHKTENKNQQQNNNWKNKNNQNNNKQQVQNKNNTNNNANNNANKNIRLNTNNTNVVIGPNNKFDSKQKDKNKYNRDSEQVKKKNKTKTQTKEKYTKPVQDLVGDETTTITRTRKKTQTGAFIKPVQKEVLPSDEIKLITIPDIISIKDLSAKLKLQPSVIVKKLFLAGKMVTANTELTYEEAENIAVEYDILCEKEKKVDLIAEALKDNIVDEEKDLIMRPPVVCVMGHVDHGKTSILDVIRKTNVIDKEAGGITQHIGAYQVKINDRLITFLDTPGHEAFTAMRLRGAKSTDIAILVVAADDGVKPQTIEAINHAKAANVEVVVAINKIDKPEANIDRVKQELSEYELIPEDWGGSTTFCEVSAKKNIGITNLLEMILLTADVLELKANPNRKARGIVLEAELDKGRGPVARVLIQKGTLHIGDYVAMGKSFGKVRAMIDCNGQRVKEALPSTPVEILGLNDTPLAGDTLVSFDGEKEAKNYASLFISEDKQKLIEDSKQKVTLDALFDKIKAGEVKELPIILKTDVMGSSEALKDSLEKLSNDEVAVRVIHTGVGNINESDVNLASASNAIIIGFNIKAESNVKSIIDKEKVDVRIYDIIYKAIEDVELAMKGMLSPVYEEKIDGHLTIRQIFKVSSIGNIAGCIVNDGVVTKNSKVRIFRGDDKIFEGNISSLKRFKDEVKEVKQGFECGIVMEDFNDFQVDDNIECYSLVAKSLV